MDGTCQLKRREAAEDRLRVPHDLHAFHHFQLDRVEKWHLSLKHFKTLGKSFFKQHFKTLGLSCIS